MALEYTLALTSCGRPDLLDRTLETFFAHVDILPSKTVLLEDDPKMHGSIVNIPSRAQITTFLLMCNDPRLGQIRSCDKLMGMVDTELVFWCEEDWEFKEGEFIQPSYDVLCQYPEIFTVSLRGHAWNHPLVTCEPYPFLIAEPGWQGGWGGMAFNPGLRRRSDYLKVGPYAQGGLNMWACQSELELSRRYLAAGYRIADLGRPIIEHLGHNRSKTREQF